MAADILRKQNLRRHCFVNSSAQHSDAHAGLSSAEHVFRILLKGRATRQPATNIEVEARFCIRIKGIGIPMRWMQADSRIEQLQALEVIHANRLAGFASDRRGEILKTRQSTLAKFKAESQGCQFSIDALAL